MWSHTVTLILVYLYISMILHVFYSTSSAKKHPTTLAHLRLSARFACPNAAHLQKMVGLPRTFRQPHICGQPKKFGFRKLLFCIVESAWIAQKRIVGLTMVSKSIFVVLSYNHLKNESAVMLYPIFLEAHSKISKHPAFQSQVLWILPRPRFGNFS